MLSLVSPRFRSCGRLDVALKTENRPLDSIFIEVEILLAQVLNPSSGVVSGSDRNSAGGSLRLALNRHFERRSLLTL